MLAVVKFELMSHFLPPTMCQSCTTWTFSWEGRAGAQKFWKSTCPRILILNNPLLSRYRSEARWFSSCEWRTIDSAWPTKQIRICHPRHVRSQARPGRNRLGTIDPLRVQNGSGGLRGRRPRAVNALQSAVENSRLGRYGGREYFWCWSICARSTVRPRRWGMPLSYVWAFLPCCRCAYVCIRVLVRPSWKTQSRLRTSIRWNSRLGGHVGQEYFWCRSIGARPTVRPRCWGIPCRFILFVNYLTL